MIVELIVKSIYNKPEHQQIINLRKNRYILNIFFPMKPLLNGNDNLKKYIN